MKILFTLLTFGTRAANQKHKQAKSNNKQPAYNKKRLKGNIQMTLSIYLSTREGTLCKARWRRADSGYKQQQI